MTTKIKLIADDAITAAHLDSSASPTFTNLILTGNLTVQGTTTTLDTTNLNVEDKNITLNYGTGDTSSNADGAGLTIQDAVNGSTDATITWVASSDEFAFSHPASIVNAVGGDTVLNLAGSYGSGNNVALLGFARNGGAVAGDIRYTDATTDMEIGTSTAHAFSLKTSNTKRLTVDSSGRVGIGMTPAANFALEVQATSGGNALRLKGRNAAENAGWLAWTDYAGNVEAAMYATADNLIFANTTSYTERMRIDSSGDVGIGTTSPTEKLTVNGALAITGALADDRSATAAMDFSSGTTRFVSYGASSTHGQFAFRTATTGASSTERVRINHQGNISFGAQKQDPSISQFFNGITGNYGSGLSMQNNGYAVLGLSNNFFINSSTQNQRVLAQPAQQFQLDHLGNFLWQSAATGTAGGTFSLTEHMRLDAAGTLYLGTHTHTPLHSAQTGIVFENGSILNDITRGNGKSISLAQNLMVDSGNTWVTLEAGEGSYYQQYNGNHYFATDAGSGGALVDASPSTLLKLHKTGNDIDFSSNVSNDYTPRLNLYSKSTGAYCGEINFYSKHGSNEWVAASIFATGGSGYGTGNPPSGGMRLYVRGAYGDTHAINAVQIDADGTVNGNFNDTSDIALKKDIVSLSASDSITAIKALNPVSFKWKLDDKATSGFIAQEVETHLPNDVVGEDWRAEVLDASQDNPGTREEGSKGKAINSTGILAHAVKVIQEQQKEIEALKARVTTLEG